MRTERDLKDLGIPQRCGVTDGFTVGTSSDKYLDPLQRHVAYLHSEALANGFAVMGFVIVLMLFTLSDFFGGTSQRVCELSAILGIPISLVLAATHGDDDMARSLLAPSMSLLALFLLDWYINLRSVLADVNAVESGPIGRRSSLRPHSDPLKDGGVSRKHLTGWTLVSVYVFIASSAGLLLTPLLGQHGGNDKIQTTMVFVVSSILMIALAFAVFRTIGELRMRPEVKPNRLSIAAARKSWPSSARVLIPGGLFAVIAPWTRIAVGDNNAGWLRAADCVILVLLLLMISNEIWRFEGTRHRVQRPRLHDVSRSRCKGADETLTLSPGYRARARGAGARRAFR